MLGAFVLDQLDEPERSSVRAHVDGCPGCQAEVSELAPLAPALQGVDPARLSTLPSPPPELGDQVLAAIRSSRRGANNRRLAKRGAAALLLAAVIVGAFFLGLRMAPVAPTTAAPPVEELSVRLAVPGVQADAGLVKHTWGTELRLEATGLRDGGAYTVTFTRDDGTQVPAGTFLGTGGNPLRCSLNAAVPLADTAGVTVTDAAGALVLDADVA
jgi:Putative zinc-finger